LISCFSGRNFGKNLPVKKNRCAEAFLLCVCVSQDHFPLARFHQKAIKQLKIANETMNTEASLNFCSPYLDLAKSSYG
jgi:hypothetical protein